MATERKKTKETAAKIVQLKITLQGIKPPVWRRVLVPEDASLHKLHKIIQTVMGWSDTHLHAFHIHGMEYAPPDPDSDPDTLDSRKVKLKQVIKAEKDHFSYVYDFGDNWEHRVIVEKITPLASGEKYPQCVAGVRSAPPEDSGGPFCYDEFLEKWTNPKHPEHEETREWAGEYFDPEEFDMEFINGELRKIRGK